MRKNVLLLGAMMMASMSLMAQTKGGGISQSALQQMEKASSQVSPTRHSSMRLPTTTLMTL